MKNTTVQSILIVLIIAILIIQIASVIEISNLSPQGSYSGGHGLGYLTISASGTASAQPTKGTLYVSVKGLGKTAAAATVNLSKELTQLNSSLSKYINGNTSMIQTTYYNLYNQTTYYYPGGGMAQPVYPYPGYATYNGFVANEQLTITLPNVKNLSEAIGALSLINNTEVTSASATLSDAQTTSLRASAFSNALQNATSQASILTGNATLSTQNITVDSYYFYPIPYALGASSSSGMGNATTVNPSFYSGTASVTESITIVFSYNKK